MKQDTIDLAIFDESHLDGAHVLSREANWPHRREDWAMVLSLSRGFVALEDGAVVGTAMMTPFGDTAATINMVIVAAAMRGCGLGRRLMDRALAAAGPLECRLIATAEGLPLYEKLGFRATHEIRQHQGVPDGIAAVAMPQSGRVAWAGAGDLAAIAALDRLALGMDRGPLLHLLAEAGRMAVLRAADGQVAGYGVLRPFGRGEVIGPVIAGSEEEAQALIAFLMAARPGAFLRVDTPALTHLSPWLAACGLEEVGGGIAMCTGPARPGPSAPCKPFALASQALG
ncbi:Acetyltransferase (GNAT) domain [Chelatococcus sambhunathii]|uniref:Acetyltransferase (GNAT) domain n=1 Tax=Chelatococcus sambhunathii TaxID=363953 RepID=A0ABM9U3R4_9HYPH|nr:GNAT family N-acetyltransferase [Chelatococcus sambhunathii]CUA87587.1 Acetyltransferase (GNAT) domain [Chelatococcus sambhunathii]